MSVDLYIYEEWEMRLQLEKGLRVVESGATKRILDKQWHTKKFEHDEAMAMFAELNMLEPLDSSDREILEIELANYEQVQIDEIKRKEGIQERKEVGRGVRANTKKLQEKAAEGRDRGQDLFNTFDEEGELDTTPFATLTAAEQFLVDKAEEE